MEGSTDAPAPTYIDVMAECESLASEILTFPDGKSSYPGGIRDALALPPGMEQGTWDVLLPFAVAKKKTLSSMLARLKGPVAGQAPPILAAAAAVATPSLPTTTNTAPLPTTTDAPVPAAPLATNAWPAEQYFMTRSSELPYPRLPDALTKARSIKGDKGRTETAFFWNCCHQEIVYKRRPLYNAELTTLSQDWCMALSLPVLPPTVGHVSWLRKHQEFLLVLYL
jgi:hypothetical protein